MPAGCSHGVGDADADGLRAVGGPRRRAAGSLEGLAIPEVRDHQIELDKSPCMHSHLPRTVCSQSRLFLAGWCVCGFAIYGIASCDKFRPLVTHTR